MINYFYAVDYIRLKNIYWSSCILLYPTISNCYSTYNNKKFVVMS